MCELLINDTFSLLNASLDDADMGILGAESGLSLGNPQIVHSVVDSLLRNDQVVVTTEGTGREQAIPIRINADTSGARADMAARVHKVLQNPRKLTLIPCDGFGAPAWWRIQWASMEHKFDDFGATHNHYQDYTITLGVDAWAKSTELYTSTPVTPTSGVVWTDLNIPGSAPFAGDITMVAPQPGGLIYTPGSIMVDYPSYNPLSPSVSAMPEGTYHLVVDISSYSGTGHTLSWSVAGQSGTFDLTKLPYYSGGTFTGWACLANDIYISPYSSTTGLSVTKPGGTVSLAKSGLLWAGNPLTGRTASYTMWGATGLTGSLTLVAPTASRPVVAQAVGGIQMTTELRAVGGEHRVDPGATKILGAWAGNNPSGSPSLSVSGYPAFHTEVVQKARW